MESYAEEKRWLDRVGELTTSDPFLRDAAVSLVLCEIDLAKYHGGRAYRAQILRQKIQNHGWIGGIERWMRQKEHGEFEWTAKERGLAEHSIPALVLRHAHLFTDEAVAVAQARMAGLAAQRKG